MPIIPLPETTTGDFLATRNDIELEGGRNNVSGKGGYADLDRDNDPAKITENIQAALSEADDAVYGRLRAAGLAVPPSGASSQATALLRRAASKLALVVLKRRPGLVLEEGQKVDLAQKWENDAEKILSLLISRRMLGPSRKPRRRGVLVVTSDTAREAGLDPRREP